MEKTKQRIDCCGRDVTGLPGLWDESDIEWEPCPYCGATAWYKDGAVDFVHGDDCPQGDCEPYRMSLVSIEHVQKWNNWAKQVKASRPTERLPTAGRW